jgi:hypothetical protein
MLHGGKERAAGNSSRYCARWEIFRCDLTVPSRATSRRCRAHTTAALPMTERGDKWEEMPASDLPPPELAVPNAVPIFVPPMPVKTTISARRKQPVCRWFLQFDSANLTLPLVQGRKKGATGVFFFFFETQSNRGWRGERAGLTQKTPRGWD